MNQIDILANDTKNAQDTIESSLSLLQSQYAEFNPQNADYILPINGSNSSISLGFQQASYTLILKLSDMVAVWKSDAPSPTYTDALAYIDYNYLFRYRRAYSASRDKIKDLFKSLLYQEILQVVYIFVFIDGYFCILVTILTVVYYQRIFTRLKTSVALFALLRQEDVSDLLSDCHRFKLDYQRAIDNDEYKLKAVDIEYHSDDDASSDGGGEDLVPANGRRRNMTVRLDHGKPGPAVQMEVVEEEEEVSIKSPASPYYKATKHLTYKSSPNHKLYGKSKTKQGVLNLSKDHSTTISKPHGKYEKIRKAIASGEKLSDILVKEKDDIREKFKFVYNHTTNYYPNLLFRIMLASLVIFPPEVLIFYLDYRVWTTYESISDFQNMNMQMRTDISFMQAVSTKSLATGQPVTDAKGNSIVHQLGDSVSAILKQTTMARPSDFASGFRQYFEQYTNFQETSICSDPLFKWKTFEMACNNVLPRLQREF